MKCAIYVRVSTDREEQKTSLENQRQLFIRYIADQGWDIHDFYVDIQSGTTAKRPELQRMITDAKAKKFDVILAKELSRLARNGGLSYEIRDIAEYNRIHIVTLDNAINTLKGNNHMFGLYAWMYEQESQNTSNRSKNAYRTEAESGKFKGSIPPLGYEVKGRRLYIKQDTTPDIIRRIYRNYISGKGFDRIARELYQEGIPTPAQIAGKRNASDKWQGSAVRIILTNPHYTGDLVQGRSTSRSVTSKVRDQNDPSKYIIVPDTHEAIISKKDFETVQQLIKSRKRTRPQQEIHLFTNTSYCADCGKGMHFKKNSKGYICGNYNKHGMKACTNHLVRESDLSLAILNDIKDLAAALGNDNILEKLDKKLKKQRVNDEKQIISIDNEVTKLKNRKKKALDDYYDEKIPKEDYDDYTHTINQDINELILKKQELEATFTSQDDQIVFTKLKNSLESFLEFKQLTPEILHRLIDKIEIKADGSPRIFYRFSNPLLFI